MRIARHASRVDDVIRGVVGGSHQHEPAFSPSMAARTFARGSLDSEHHATERRRPRLNAADLPMVTLTSSESSGLASGAFRLSARGTRDSQARTFTMEGGVPSKMT